MNVIILPQIVSKSPGVNYKSDIEFEVSFHKEIKEQFSKHSQNIKKTTMVIYTNSLIFLGMSI